VLKIVRKEHVHKLVFLGLAIIIILQIVVLTQVSSIKDESSIEGSEDTEKAAASAPSAPSAPNVDMEALADDDAFKGDEDAPVTIVEWSDFECPFCGRFYSQTLSQIEETYINTGKVKLVYRDFPLGFHQNAQKAAEAAECADDQGKFWEMHDMLFESGVSGGVAGFKQHAADLGLNTATFDNCLDSGEKAEEVQKDMRDGSNAGIRGTPGFIINGQLLSGAQPFAAFQQAIEAALNG